MLMTTGLVFSLLIAIAIGTVSAVRQYSAFDNVFTAFSFFGISIPAFWFGLIMLKFFGLELKFFQSAVCTALANRMIYSIVYGI